MICFHNLQMKLNIWVWVLQEKQEHIIDTGDKAVSTSFEHDVK